MKVRSAALLSIRPRPILPISGSVRSVTFTENGTPLAPQDYGYDTEDYEDEEDEYED